MTIELDPEDQHLIEKRLSSGVFATARDVIHYALASQDAAEAWLAENQAAIHEQIERGFAQIERGEGLTAEESLARLEAKQVAWRAARRGE